MIFNYNKKRIAEYALFINLRGLAYDGRTGTKVSGTVIK